MKQDNLGIRMKNYEMISQNYLMRRTPVVIRVDMKAGHTFCRGLKRPFDTIFHEAMNQTMIKAAKNIQGCYFAYTQSDEITFILQDYETLKTDAWFDYRVDKLTSITASMTTMYFNNEFRKLVEEEIWTWKNSLMPQSVELQQEVHKYHDTLHNCIQKGAMFDSRCFNIPKEEVVNLILWRQLDAERNAIQSLGQFYFSHKELQNKTCKDILKMLEEQKGVIWDDYSTAFKHGIACLKTEEGWIIDYEMPMLKGENRDYLEKLI